MGTSPSLSDGHWRKRTKPPILGGEETQRSEWVIFLIQRGISPSPCSCLMPRLENSPSCVSQGMLGSIPGVCLPDVSWTLMKIKTISRNHDSKSLVGGGRPSVRVKCPRKIRQLEQGVLDELWQLKAGW